MTAVWDVDLPASDKIVLLALADCANDEGLCWPGMAALVAKCSKGERTIQAAIKRLVASGHLTRDEVVGKGCKYLVHPRDNCAPAKPAPPQKMRATPAKTAGTPAKTAGKPSKNHQEPSKVKSEASSDDFSCDDFVESWNAVAAECGLPSIRKLTKPRQTAFRVRKREYPDIADWQSAFRCLRSSKWMHGDNDRKWRADPDFFLQSKSFTKLVEGSYAQTD